uniref:Uncharacterized protein n=1 Tax=Wuchereria bancrofti TaxID=6293 RepID=A0AAF5Q141_WUCBA
MLVECYLLFPSNITLYEALFACLLIFASFATCIKKTKNRPKPQESIMLGTTIDTKNDSKQQQSFPKIIMEKHNGKPSPEKPNIEKTLLIEFERENNQVNKSQISKIEKETAADNQNLEICKTQVATIDTSVKSEKTQPEIPAKINEAQAQAQKSVESSKIPSSGKSEKSQKDELKTVKALDTDSHATSRLEESSTKENPIV